MGKSISGRAYLSNKLREIGLSRHDAIRILDGVLEAMKEALKRGEAVEFPFGQLVQRRLWHQDGEVVIEGRRAKRRAHTVVLRLNDAGEQFLNPLYVPAPGTGEGCAPGKSH